MARLKNHAALIMAGLLLGGCSYVSDSLFPSLWGDDPVTPPPSKVAKARPIAPKVVPRPVPQAANPPRLGTSTFTPPSVTPGSPTGTAVGAKVAQMRSELGQLQSAINRHNSRLQRTRVQTIAHAQRYHGTVAAINSRLQVGTTPGNPVLINQWNVAQSQLDGVSRDIAAMNSLANNVASDSATASYLLETTRATYGLSGAVDGDHRQLSILEDEVNRTVVLIDRLLNELSEDINRQSAYVGNERKNLTTLSVAVKNGELLGSSLANRAVNAAPFQARPNSGSRAMASVGGQRRPLVVIRFDQAKVEYEQALYSAISRTLERRPQAGFDLVAVTPIRGSAAKVAQSSNAARRAAERVLRSLTSMGLPASRVTLSAGTSNQAQTNEVHIYVR
ncbi:MAG: hypothetical protein HOF95_00945 [Rhodospirillales bacterium]|nr:hypothetical protein [Rhodospirillales bacterium]